MRPSFLLLLAAVFSLSACETFKKDPKVFISVHAAGSEMDSPKSNFRRVINGRVMLFKVVPEFTSQNVVAFHPFPASDGTSGVALKLDFKATNALHMVTRMRSGEILMSMVNATPVDLVQIDKPVTDGIFTIWRGFPPELIEALDKKFPRIKDARSASEFQDMTPSTTKEKKDAKRQADREAKERAKAEADAAKRRARGEFMPELPAGELIPLD